MEGRACYHCKQWVAEGEPHNCWTTTEAALTRDLAPDLFEAWERLRETAVELGDQRIYASHNSIMFSRRSCYFFVRPKRTFLEVCVFLGREVKAPQVSRVGASSKTKFFHFIKVTHRDQVETPLIDWLSEAYAFVAEAVPFRCTAAERGRSDARGSTTKRSGRKTTGKKHTRTKAAKKTTPTRTAKKTSKA